MMMVELTYFDQFTSVSSFTTKKELIRTVVIFRFLFWFAMAISCHLIPDHNPGDDVLRFHMRLGDEPCFCRKGHVCDKNYEATARTKSSDCATSGVFSSTLVPSSAWNFILSPMTKWDAARFLTLAVQPELRDPPNCPSATTECSFAASEQAHAFFPMFPLVTQTLALWMSRYIPSFLLPPTFEGVIVLSGVLMNLLAMVIGTLALYDVTLRVCQSNHRLAMATCFVYSIGNPAYVFFATNYSESLFSMCALVGYAAMARQQYALATLSWMVGSYTRSNGTIHSLWLLQHGLAQFCFYLTCKGDRPTDSNTQRFSKGLGMLVLCIVAAILVALPVFFHDWHGYHRHCNDYSEVDSSIHPSWCHDDAMPGFSLYGYTQRKHWNVGLFRYYEFKQIPNFLLAFPIWGFSLMGIAQWIQSSLKRHGKGKLPTYGKILLWDWPIQALADSISSSTPHGDLVTNPLLLGHYAILAVLTFVGITIAHVQISTRMLLSSSPSILWFLAHLWDSQDHRLRFLVKGYSVLYMILGIVLHVNFLPWT